MADVCKGLVAEMELELLGRDDRFNMAGGCKRKREDESCQSVVHESSGSLLL